MSEAMVRAARALVGVRFRPQGRDPAHGLDCVGVVASVFGLRDVRRDYRLRSGDAAALEDGFADRGFAQIAGADAAPGDVLIVRAGAGQLHMVVLVPGGFVHADAGLGRVVEVPGDASWPVVSGWRAGCRPGSASGRS